MDLAEWSSNQGLKNRKAGLVSLESRIIDIVTGEYASRLRKCLSPNNTPNRRIFD